MTNVSYYTILRPLLFVAVSENTTIYFNHTSAFTISGNTFKRNGHLITSTGPLHEEVSLQVQLATD